MRIFKIISVFILIIPTISFAQLKKDTEPINISNTLKTGAMQQSLLGFLDPARFNMSHSFSVSYTSFGGHGMVMNSYLNTINYQFNDQLWIRTKLGIMGSPYSSLPNQPYMKDMQFFGGAELIYKPTENSSLLFRIESVPANYYYNQGMNFGYPYNYRPSIFDN